MKFLEYWRGEEGVAREYPLGRKWPDFRMVSYLQELAEGLICDVGCGSGRLSSLFAPANYIGVDVNPVAIAKARREFPEHVYQMVTLESPLPIADTYLFHTVLLHLPDGVLDDEIQKCKNGTYVLVAETMDSKFADGNYVFNRDREQYRRIFHQHGFSLLEERRMYMEARPGYWDIQKYIRKDDDAE